MNKVLNENLHPSYPEGVHISTFLLERYHIGEITQEEKLLVEKALARDKTLAAALADLDRADNDFYEQFPLETFFPADQNSQPVNTRRFSLRHIFQPISRIPHYAWGFCIAAIVMVIAFPFFILKNPVHEKFGDRMKGASIESSSIELNVYLRGRSSNEVTLLPDQSNISDGNTIQLVYKVPSAKSNEKYGIIFSIDGRSSVTMHYPYRPRQSTLLVSGKSVHLDEAFTLDDAPDYEIFFFVARDTPMDIETTLITAKQLAREIRGNPREAKHLGASAFKDCEIKVFTLVKQ
ncbi:MAG: hypothetical protein FWE72_02560 [Spirochaetaceae bacterium]|nr:hypothetical protein [Spirochaetaceae bacterium]